MEKCLCGCGEEIDNSKKQYQSKYIHGHYVKVNNPMWNSSTAAKVGRIVSKIKTGTWIGKNNPMNNPENVKKVVEKLIGTTKEKCKWRKEAGEKVSKAMVGNSKICGENNVMKRPEVIAKISGNNNHMKRQEMREWFSKSNPMKNPEIAKKMQENQKKQFVNGRQPYGGKGVWYTSPTAGRVYLRASYENLVGPCLDKWKLNWKYQDLRIQWFSKDGKSHTYFVDFHVFGNEIEYCIETKGFITENDSLKWKAFEEKFPNIPLIIVMKEDLWMFSKS